MIFDLPPAKTGTEAEQLEGIYRYLVRLQDQLTDALGSISIQNFTEEDRLAVARYVNTDGKGDQQVAPTATQEALSLKAIIIKTADVVAASEQEIRKQLVREYTAISDFGKLYEKATNDVIVTPEGTTQEFTLSQAITGLRDQLGEYDTTYKGYIKSGLLRYNGTVPIYGVAIGKDVVEFKKDGTVVYTDGNKVAELTDDELAFYQNSAKIASYTANGISFLGDVSIKSDKKIIIGNAVEIAGNHAVLTGSMSFNRKAGSTIGAYSFAEGYQTAATASYSHAEGLNTEANGVGSHAEGEQTIASGQNSHAEGGTYMISAGNYVHTQALGGGSHAEGAACIARSDNSHAEGIRSEAGDPDNPASTLAAHAEGVDTKSKGYAAHAEGLGTIATGQAKHVQGRYNIDDLTNTYAHIVGGGTETQRKNIHTIDWQGNATFAGGIVLYGENELVLYGDGSVKWRKKT